MHVRHARASLVATAALLLLGACSTTTAPGDSGPAASSARGPAATGAAGGTTGATVNGSAAAPAAGGGDPTTNACGLLTVDEIKQATGLTVQPGVLQNSDGQSDCEWTVSDSASVGLTVSTYQDFLWQAGSTAGNSKPVTGIGDAAFKGWPTFAALNVKAKGYQIVFAIADFQVTQDVIDTGDLALAKLVLPRL